MKRNISLALVLGLFACLAAFATDAKKDAKKDMAKESTVTGWVTDPACGASHDKAKMSDSECAKKCSAKDGKLVIVTDGDNKVWAIENADAVKGHEGHHVKVTGHPNADAGSIHIATVAMLDEAKGMKKDKDKAMNK
jgi:hypothetical protein